VVDAKANKLHKIDTATGRIEKSADVAKSPTGLCLTPDGSTVWVISSEDKDKGKLERFTASDLTAKKAYALNKMIPTEVVATDGGRVCVSAKVADGYYVVVLETEKAFEDVCKVTSKDVPLALCLSADQGTVYLSPRSQAATFTIVAVPTKGEKPK